MEMKAALVAEAARLGFIRARFASVEAPLSMLHYDAFLAAGWHGQMEWLATGRDERANVERLLPGARSILVLGFDYTQALPPDPGGLTGRVASYAWGRDYHNFVLKRVRKLQALIQRMFPDVNSYSSVDMRPVYERAWAARAGVGFVGKNACQILPGETSYILIATLLLTADVEADTPLGEHCGRCTRCIDTCPTQAIVSTGGLIATRCISYLTIEHDGPIESELRPRIGRWLFGCDDCQEVCPHVHARRPPPPEVAPDNAWLDLRSILAEDDAALRARFTGSPLRRAAGPRLRRNAAYVLGNLRDPAAIPALEAVREGGAVGDAAEWALTRIRAR